MSRTDKLLERILVLRKEYVALVRSELERVASGAHSRFLVRKAPYMFDGRFWRTPECDRLEHVEHELAKLSKSFDDAPSREILTLVEEYVASVAKAADRVDGGTVALARQTLARLIEMQRATQLHAAPDGGRGR